MKKYLVIWFTLFFAASSLAQEKTVLYSHYSFNGLAINPAYAGSHDMLSINLSHRSQWVGFEGAPSYNIASIHAPYKDTRIGLGLLVMNESIGLRKYTAVYLNYAHRMELGRGKLSLGLKGGIGTGKMDALDMGDDLVFSDNASHYLLPNFGVGFYYYTPNFYAGLSVPLLLHFRSNGSGEIKSYHSFHYYEYYLTAGAKLPIAENWKLHPSALFQYDLPGGVIVDGGLSIIYKDNFEAGVSYRNKQAIIMLIDFKLNYQFRVGIAYDYGMGEINTYNRNSFEVALEYNFGYRIKASNPTVF